MVSTRVSMVLLVSPSPLVHFILSGLIRIRISLTGISFVIITVILNGVVYSFAWPASWYLYSSEDGVSGPSRIVGYSSSPSLFTQRYGNLEYLDAFFESQFYPSSVSSTNRTYNRFSLFYQIIRSDIGGKGSAGDGYPVSTVPTASAGYAVWGNSTPSSQFSTSGSTTGSSELAYFVAAHPMAVVPSNPDRYSRLLPVGSSQGVSMSGVSTIPQLAIASRLQEYKDLLGAGGSRYSDWLETFLLLKSSTLIGPNYCLAHLRLLTFRLL